MKSNLERIRAMMGNTQEEDPNTLWVKLTPSTCMRRDIAEELQANPLSSLID